jgi:hypothetical protein
MDDINLHFTGDFHAIGAVYNLLSAVIDNHIHWDNALNIDPRRITWRRVLDMNDRALREITTGLGGPGNGVPRESGFDITVASEVMAVFCLATSLEDLRTRLGNITVAYTRDRKPVTVRELKVEGAMTALLRDAFQPNLVQTLENNPALMHGGPFANIAHGCNSIMATKTALKLADYVVTEAGFGADLGAEKFFDIKCRKAGLHPDAVVLVATAKALKMHGGVAKDELKRENVKAVIAGCENLGRHIRNIGQFGVPVTVAVNHFITDTAAEHEAIRKYCADFDVQCTVASHWENGGKGAIALAEQVLDVSNTTSRNSGPCALTDHTLEQGAPYCAHDLRRRRHYRGQEGARAVCAIPGRGLRPLPDLRGQNAIQFLHRSPAARRAERPRSAHTRAAACDRRRIPGGDLRRDHDHAGTAAKTGIGKHQRRRQAEYYRCSSTFIEVCAFFQRTPVFLCTLWSMAGLIAVKGENVAVPRRGLAVRRGLAWPGTDRGPVSR